MQEYIRFDLDGPVLPGSVSTAHSQCGKPNCACKGDPPRLHGIYYRWTGLIDGKRTTKTISRQTAMECKKRIRNYRKLQRQIAKLLRQSIIDAPWTQESSKTTKRRGK
ncbi:MAG: hypothetical protein KJ927_04470 [Candidatus Eisenbacteria bacterium]|nr:hypothetical protein [Candidatus Eisenbacteria bacterium]MBU1947943.1 hypothetical protein [Candidatus Eisenbacteria bacterium]